MKVINKSIGFFMTILMMSNSFIHASSNKTTSGLTLLEASGARAASLGEAFSGIENDASGMNYNPASLTSLQSSQVSFLYNKGIADDSYGHLLWGSPSGWGASIGYYKGGETDLSSDGITSRTAVVQKDLLASLAFSHKAGHISYGIAGKYISSELAETAKAKTFSSDLGMQMPIASRMRFGAAIQNLGGKITYMEEKQNLPTQARAGISMGLFKSSLLLVDGIYDVHQSKINPALGFETMVGPLALRAGYKTGADIENVTMGAGFMMGKFNLDYAFGLVQNLDSRQRISMSMKFGGDNALEGRPTFQTSQIQFKGDDTEKKVAMKESTEKPAVTFLEKQKAGEVKESKLRTMNRMVYSVKPGDTLALIARRNYGSSSEWRRILAANQHLLNNGESLTVGEKLVLP